MPHIVISNWSCLVFGLALKTYSPRLRSCGRATNDSAGCWSTLYNTGGSPYSRVCGRIRGYQFGATSAFFGVTHRQQGINVDGVSLTHGGSNSHTHIWTFASGLSEIYDGRYTQEFCRCVTNQALPPPSFVGNHYSCESGRNTAWADGIFIFYPCVLARLWVEVLLVPAPLSKTQEMMHMK